MVNIKNYTKRMFYLDESFHNHCSQKKIVDNVDNSVDNLNLSRFFPFFSVDNFSKLSTGSFFHLFILQKTTFFLYILHKFYKQLPTILNFMFSEIVPDIQLFILNFSETKRRSPPIKIQKSLMLKTSLRTQDTGHLVKRR